MDGGDLPDGIALGGLVGGGPVRGRSRSGSGSGRGSGLGLGAGAGAGAGGPGSGLSARLERWASEVRVDDAVRARSRERWLRQAAEEGGTLVGVLADLAESGAPVVVTTVDGRRHRGGVELIGRDFVALTTVAVGDVLVVLEAVGSLRTAPGAGPVSGDRRMSTRRDLRLADVLAGAAADRDRVLVVTTGGSDTVAGELRTVGRDVLVVRTDGDPPGTAYVPLAAVAEVVLTV
jgi:hypothetical protein